MAETTYPKPLLTKQSLNEALDLSKEILEDIESKKSPLQNVVLKAIRLARLVNDDDMYKVLLRESKGYPRSKNSANGQSLALAKIANRVKYRREKSGKITPSFSKFSIAEMEESMRAIELLIPSAVNQEKGDLLEGMSRIAQFLAGRRTFLHDYALKIHYELKYSSISDDVFSRIRMQADRKIGEIIPDSTKQFTSVYENLKSENPEDWSNAVHSCRRILEALADVLRPPSEAVVKAINGQEQKVKMGKENTINRLLDYVEANSDSEKFTQIVGSNLNYLHDRLRSVHKAANKGSHAIVTKEEADRYVIYTYLIVSDILSLKENKSPT